MASTSALWSPDHLRKLQAWEDEEDAGDLPRLTKRDMLSKQKQFQHQQQKNQLAVAAGGVPSLPARASAAAKRIGSTPRPPPPPPPVAHQYSSCIFGPTSPVTVNSCHTSDTCSTTVLSSSNASFVSDHGISPPPPPAPPSSPNPTSCTPSPPLPKTTKVVSGVPMAADCGGGHKLQQQGQQAIPGANIPPRRMISPFSSLTSSPSSSSSPFRMPLRRGGGEHQAASKDQGESNRPIAATEIKRVNSLPSTPSRGPTASSPLTPPSPSSFDLNKILCFPATLFQLAASTTAGATTTTTATTVEATPPRHSSNGGSTKQSSPPSSSGTPPVVSAPFSPQQLLILDDLRHLLSGKSGSEAFEFLQHMVVDLMREVDCTNDKMDEQVEKWKKRHENWLEQRREIADCVAAALQSHIEDGGPRGHVRCKKRLLHQLSSSPSASSKASLSLSSKPIVEGTNLVLDHLTDQIKQLRQENEKLLEKIQQQQSTIDDLGGVAESRLFKIEALEQQFVALNSSRGNLAKKLVDKTNQMIKLQFGGIPRLVSVQTTSSNDSVEVQQVEEEEKEETSVEIHRKAAVVVKLDHSEDDDTSGDSVKGRAPSDETEQASAKDDDEYDDDEDKQALLTHSLD